MWCYELYFVAAIYNGVPRAAEWRRSPYRWLDWGAADEARRASLFGGVWMSVKSSRVVRAD